MLVELTEKERLAIHHLVSNELESQMNYAYGSGILEYIDMLSLILEKLNCSEIPEGSND